MSVINRMLSDLERRGAPSPQSGEQEMRPAGPRRRRQRYSTRLALSGLAVVLIMVAASLWLLRGDRILAALQPVAESDALAPVPELVGVSFDRSDDRARLQLQVAGDMAWAPRFSRSGRNATLIVNAGSDDLVLPAPPREQSVFRGISLGSDASNRTRIHLEVATTAELELHVTGGEIALLGRTPQAEPAAITDRGAGDSVLASASESVDSVEPVESGQPAGGSNDPVREPSDSAAGAAGVDAAAEESPGAGDAGDKGGSPAADGGVAADSNTGDENKVRKTQTMSPETRARRRYREGREAVTRGELATARRALHEALDLDPSLDGARDLLVGLLRRAGETAAARRLLADGVERAPERVQYAMQYARLLVDTGELDRASAVLEGARANGAGSAGYHALVAAVEQRRGRHGTAASEYTRALELRADNGLWWLGLGISLVAMDKPREARAAFREARASGMLSESLDRWAQGRIEELGTER